MVCGLLTRINAPSLPSLAHPAKQPEEEKSGLAVGRAQWLCESRGGRPGLPDPNSPYGPCGRKATLKNRAQELCESRGGRESRGVPNSPYGPCGREATLNQLINRLAVG